MTKVLQAAVVAAASNAAGAALKSQNKKAYMEVPEEGHTEVAPQLDLFRRQCQCGWLKEYDATLPLGSAWVVARSNNEKAREGRALMFRLWTLINSTAVFSNSLIMHAIY